MGMPLLLSLQETIEHGPRNAGVMALNWLPAATSLVVFLVAFGFLYVKVWPKIIQGLDDRDRKIRQEIQAAEDARRHAGEALARYEESLANARKEAGEMITRAKTVAAAAAQELTTRNEAQLADMKQRATREIESAKRAAIAELHAETATLATEIAGKILKREISAADQQRLIDESLGELAGAESG